MAIHYYIERVWTATQPELTLPHATYHGFAIGPMSDLGTVQFVGGLGSDMPRPFELVAGAVIPVNPFTGNPIIGHLNRFGPYGVPILNRLHIIGFTAPWELACQVRRAPDRPVLESSKGAGGTLTWLLAFHNRQHGLFIINSSAAVTLGIYGRSYSSLLTAAPGRTAIQTGIAIAVGDNSVHVGGTDHEEPFDTLELEFTGANAADISGLGHVGGEFAR